MLIKLKWEPADGSPAPAKDPLVGVKDDQPVHLVVPVICTKLGIKDFTGYKLYLYPDGKQGDEIDQLQTFASYGLKNGNHVLIRNPDVSSKTEPISAPSPTIQVEASIGASISIPDGRSQPSSPPPEPAFGKASFHSHDDSQYSASKKSFASDEENTSGSMTSRNRTQTSIGGDSTVQLKRSELEETIEDQLFTSEGAGEIHPLYAAKVNILQNKQKKERILCVVRDWCGAYAFFTLSTAGLLGKQLVISDTLPLVDQTRTEDAGTSGTFIQYVDDIPFEIEASYSIRQQLGVALKLAYDSMYLDKTKSEIAQMRLASVDFANTYHDVQPTTSDVDKVLISCFATGKSEGFTQLRRLVSKQATRDHAVNKILVYLLSKQFTAARVANSLESLRQCVLSPTPSESMTYMDQLTQALLAVHEDQSLGQDVCDLAVRLLDDFRVCAEATSQWKGRLALQDVPFPDVFFARSTSTGKRSKKKESMAKNVFRAGIYVAIYYFSPGTKSILLDMNGNLPAVYVGDDKLSQDIMACEPESPDMLWALSWNSEYPNIALKDQDAKAFPFRASFVDAIQSLRILTGARDLGKLYDKPIYLAATNTTLLVHVAEVDEGKVFRGSDPLVFNPMNVVEHKLYQRYCDLPVQARLEQLSTSYNGPRFFQAMSDYLKARVLPEPGVYLGYLCTLSSLKGLHVMVPDSGSRHMIPHVPIADRMSDADLAWVQGIHIRKERNLPLIDFEVLQSDDGLPSFQQRFVQAMERLQSELGTDDLGRLYDIEVVDLDEKNNIKLICFCAYPPTLDLPPQFRGRYMWRRMELFEVEHYSLFCPRRFSEFQKYIRPLQTELAVLSRTLGSTIDEVNAKRVRQKTISSQYHRRTMLWTPMQWAPRLAYWCSRTLPAFTAKIADTEGRSISEIVTEARAKRKIPHVVLRNIITSDVEGQPWDDMAQQLEAMAFKDSDELDMLEDDATLPEIKPPSQAKALEQAYEDITVDFTLEELLPSDRPWSPTAADIGRMIACEIIEEALVEAVDGAEFGVVTSVVRDMVDLLECTDDLVEDVVASVEKDLTEQRIREDQQRFVNKLDELFDASSIPYVAAEARQKQLESESGTLTTPYDAAMGTMIQDFNNTVTMVEQLLSVIDTLIDMTPAVDTVTELSVTAIRRAEKFNKKPAKPKASPVSKLAYTNRRRATDESNTPVVKLSLEEVLHGSGLPAFTGTAQTTPSMAAPVSVRSTAKPAPLRVGSPMSARTPAASSPRPRGSTQKASTSPERTRMIRKGETFIPQPGSRQPAQKSSLLDTVSQSILKRAYFKQRAIVDVQRVRAQREGELTEAPHMEPVTRVIRSLEPDKKEELSVNINKMLPAGSPSRKFLKGLRNRHTLYRFSAADGKSTGSPTSQSPASAMYESSLASSMNYTQQSGQLAVPSRDGARSQSPGRKSPASGKASTPSPRTRSRNSGLSGAGDDFDRVVDKIYGKSPIAVFVSGDGTAHEISSFAAKQCASACLLSSVDHYDSEGKTPIFVWRDIGEDVMKSVVKFLEGPETVGSAKDLLRGKEWQMLSAANTLQTPLLFIYCAGHIYESRMDRAQLQQMLLESFMMTLGSEEWDTLEEELGAQIPVFDFLWYLRCVVEFESSTPYAEKAGKWKPLFCEQRIENFLCAGAEHVDETEQALWKNVLGPHVQTLNLSFSDASDNEMILLVDSCPHVRSISIASTPMNDAGFAILVMKSPNLEVVNLSSTQLGDEAAFLMARALPKLKQVNVENTRVSGEGIEALMAALPALEIAASPAEMAQSPANIVKILVATDNHLGYMEKDPERADDSFESFEEVFKIAREKQVDFVLLGGDLFHENKPSRRTLYRCMSILRKYCLGDNPVRVQMVSDPAKSFQHGFGVNYESPNMNVDLPVFSIHGNHDDPAGDGQLAALDLIAISGLVNYFGKSETLENVTLYPLLFNKGTTRLAIYGLGNIRDERLARLFNERKVKLMRPTEHAEQWFSVLVLHQNRVAHDAKTSVNEAVLDDFLDLVIWGHEHECLIDPVQSAGRRFCITQPGSSVATSLIEGEAKKKQVGVLEIIEDKFRLTPVTLNTVRPFLIEDIVLSDHLREKASEDEVMELLNTRIDEMITRAPLEFPDSIKKPLIRLRVDYTGFSIFNIQRFGQRFVTRVANPDDLLLFKRQKKPTVKKQGTGAGQTTTLIDDDNLRPENLDAIRIEDLIDEYLGSGARQSLTILHPVELGSAVSKFVEKEEKHAIEEFVVATLEQTQGYLKRNAQQSNDSTAIQTAVQARMHAHNPFATTVGGAQQTTITAHLKEKEAPAPKRGKTSTQTQLQLTTKPTSDNDDGEEREIPDAFMRLDSDSDTGAPTRTLPTRKTAADTTASRATRGKAATTAKAPAIAMDFNDDEEEESEEEQPKKKATTRKRTAGAATTTAKKPATTRGRKKTDGVSQFQSTARSTNIVDSDSDEAPAGVSIFSKTQASAVSEKRKR